jgi:excisionase family DNA binding protein
MRLAPPPARSARAAAAARRQLDRPLTAADVLTASEVAKLMHVPRSTIEDWARRGVIPSRKVGRRRLYLRPKIEALLLDERP